MSDFTLIFGIFFKKIRIDAYSHTLLEDPNDD